MKLQIDYPRVFRLEVADYVHKIKEFNMAYYQGKRNNFGGVTFGSDKHTVNGFNCAITFANARKWNFIHKLFLKGGK